RHPPHLPAEPRRDRRLARLLRPVLEPGAHRVQAGRRAARRGGTVNTQTAGTSVQTSIMVEAPIDKAFSVFTEDMGSWWPAGHHILQAELAEMVFEPRAGGAIVDRGADATECRWARVPAYGP